MKEQSVSEETAAIGNYCHFWITIHICRIRSHPLTLYGAKLIETKDLKYPWRTILFILQCSLEIRIKLTNRSTIYIFSDGLQKIQA